METRDARVLEVVAHGAKEVSSVRDVSLGAREVWMRRVKRGVGPPLAGEEETARAQDPSSFPQHARVIVGLRKGQEKEL